MTKISTAAMHSLQVGVCWVCSLEFCNGCLGWGDAASACSCHTQTPILCTQVARLAAAGSAQQKPGMATPPRRWPEPAGGSGSGLGSRGAWPAACGGSGGGAAARRGASASLTPERKGHVMIVQPRGRKGAAGRSAATMPQVRRCSAEPACAFRLLWYSF